MESVKKAGQDRYKELFKKVRAIIDKHDPAGLSPGTREGTPVDEYNSETAVITTFLIHNQEEIKLDRKILIDEINRVWQEYFGQPCGSAERISSDIIHLGSITKCNT